MTTPTTRASGARSIASEVRFACPLPNGLHARPASHLAEVASTVAAPGIACTLINERSGATADMTSVLSLIAADVRYGDPCVIRVAGAEVGEATETLRRFVTTELAGYDRALPDVVSGGPHGVAPRVLRAAQVSWINGLPVSRGIASGAVVIVRTVELKVDGKVAGSPLEEQQCIDRAIAAVVTALTEERAARGSGPGAELLGMHLGMLRDRAWLDKIREGIGAGHTAAWAVAEAGEHFAATLRASTNGYLRERALDVKEVTQRVLSAIEGEHGGQSADAGLPILLTEPSVIVAERLTVQQVLSCERAMVAALVLEDAGTTSHAVILARSLGIPTVVGVERATRRLVARERVIVDAMRGLVVSDDAGAVRRFYTRELEAEAGREAVRSRFAVRPGATADGRLLEVGANIGAAEELESAFARGADGIGLLRTELVFATWRTAPTEDEQAAIYERAVRAAAGKPVIIRTFDVGGDKPLVWLPMAVEGNPFLGERGVRWYQAHPEIIDAQIRAILRASAVGPVRLMIPMVSTLDEIRWVKGRIAEAGRALADRGKAGVVFDPALLVGAMIEVPAAAFQLHSWCTELDFFSIGTNDLIQYAMAADRTNPRVASLASVRQPGFVWLLVQIVDTARGHERWVGVCGEMAADVRNLPLFVALGVNEVSVPPGEVATVKAHLAGLSMEACRETLRRALSCANAAEMEAVLAQHTEEAAAVPLVDPELVRLDVSCESKDEAIREAVRALYVTGRTDEPDVVEDAVWAREATYSTGLGHGLAIPHCRTDAVRSASIVVMRPREAVDWGAVDGAPVRLVVLLVSRASGEGSDQHLRVFSRLARRLVDEAFRERLMVIDSAEGMIDHLGRELGE